MLALRLFREPERRGAGAAGRAGASQPSVRELVRDGAQALRRRRELLFVLLGGALLCYGSGSAMLSVTWLVEERGYAYDRATLLAGGMAVGAGLLGNLAGGLFGDFCARRFRNGRIWSLAAMTAFCSPIGMLFYNLPAGTPLFFACWFGPLVTGMIGDARGLSLGLTVSLAVTAFAAVAFALAARCARSPGGSATATAGELSR